MFGGPATPASRLAAAAPTPAPAHHGGGGLFGSVGRFLGNIPQAVGAVVTGHGAPASGGGPLGSVERGLQGAANFVNPVNVTTHVIPQLAGAALTDIGHGAEMVTGRPVTYTPSRPNESNQERLAQLFPFTGGLLSTGQKAGVDVAGLAQGAAGVGSGAQGLIGRGFQHEASRRWAADPFSAAIGDVGTAALVAGPVGRAVGAVGEGVAAGAEEGSLAARLGGGLSAAGRGAGAVGEAANQVMTAPFRPIGGLYRLARGVGEGLAGTPEGLAQTRMGALGQGMGEGLADVPIPLAGRTVGEMAQGRALIGQTRDLLGAAKDEEAVRKGQNVAYQRQAAAAAAGDGEVVQAAINREAGREGGAQVALRAQEHGVGLPGDMPTERVARLTAGQGSPEEQARVEATAAVLRTQAREGASGFVTPGRQAEELAGVGRVAGPLNPEQAGMTPLSRNVEAQTAPFQKQLDLTRGRLAELTPKLEKAQAARMYTPGELASLRTSAPEAFAQAERVATEAVAREREAAARAAGIRTKVLPSDADIAQQLAGAIIEYKGGARPLTQSNLGLYAEEVTAPVPIVPRGMTRLAAVAQRAGAATGEAAARTEVAGRLGERAQALRNLNPEAPPARQLALGEETTAGQPGARTAPPPLPPEVTRPLEEAAVRARAAAQAAAHAHEAGVGAAEQLAGGVNPEDMARAVSEVRQARTAYRQAIKAEADQMRGNVDMFFHEGKIAPIPKDAGGEYDPIRALAPADRATFYSGTGTGLGPDQWLETVRRLLPDSNMSLDQAVEHVASLEQARRELGRALSPNSEQGIADLVARRVPPDEAGYARAVFHGTPQEAAARLAAEFNNAAGPDRLDEAIGHVKAWLDARTNPQPEGQLELAKLTPLEQQIADQQLTRYASNRATAGLEAARTDLVNRLTAIGRQQGVTEGRTAGAGLAQRSFALELDRLAKDERLAAGRLKAPDVGTAQQRLAQGAASSTLTGIKAGQLEERAQVLERLHGRLTATEAHQETRLEQEQKAAAANPANAPARARPALLANRAQAEAINRSAAAADAVFPGAGAEVRQLTEGLPTVLAELREQGIDPTHFTGPGPRPEPAAPGRLARIGQRLPQVRKLASEHVKETGVLPSSLEDIRRTEDARARQVVANETAKTLAAKLAPSANDRGIDIKAIPRDLVPYNPASPFETVPRGQVTPDTPLLPKSVFDSFRNQLGPAPTKGAVAAAWDAAIRGGKDLGVGLSPAYWASVIAADSIKNMALGNEGAAAWIRNLVPAYDLIREHPEDPLVAAVAGRGLSADLGEPGVRGNLLHRVARPGWEATGRVQDVQRVAQGLAQRDAGASIEDQVAEARRVNGRFDNLTGKEQNVRRAIPGLAFYKHIASLTLRLPIDSPGRMAMLGYLYNAIGQPNHPVSGIFNPAGVIGGLPSTAPPIRFGAALAGLHLTTNLKTLGGETSPFTSPGRGGNAAVLEHGWQAIPEAGYLAAQQFPVSRGLLAAAEPNVHRYQTGEPTKTAAPYPGGRLAGVGYGLGVTAPIPKAKTTGPAAGGRLSGRSGRSGRSARLGGRR